MVSDELIAAETEATTTPVLESQVQVPLLEPLVPQRLLFRHHSFVSTALLLL